MGSLNEPASEPAKAAARRANSFFSSSSSQREKSSLEIKKEKRRKKLHCTLGGKGRNANEELAYTFRLLMMSKSSRWRV